MTVMYIRYITKKHVRLQTFLFRKKKKKSKFMFAQACTDRKYTSKC